MWKAREGQTPGEELPRFIERAFGKAIESGEWWSWDWQVRHRLASVDSVLEVLDGELAIRPSIVEGMRQAERRFRVSVTPCYLALATPRDPRDPILPQCLPDPCEASRAEGDLDPFMEKDLEVAPGLVHRYPDRALLVLTNFCSTLCRHCMRKREWQRRFDRLTDAQVDEAVAAIVARPKIRDVLLSGGDPLNLPPAFLGRVLGKLRRAADLDCIRLGSRIPVTLPMRVDDEMLRALEPHAPLYLNTHFNHAREVSPESVAAVRRLQVAGVVVSNQAVLLRGVNDRAEDLLQLARALLRAGIRAYYLHQCDPVEGATQFRVGLNRGVELVASLAGKVSGLAIPHYVVDLPGGEGKVAAAGPHLRRRSPEEWIYQSPLSGRLVAIDATEGTYGGVADWIVEQGQMARYAAAPS